MNSNTQKIRRAAALAAVVTSALMSTAVCAQTIQPAKIAFLMPDQSSTRYEEHDSPGFKAEMKKLCAACEVLYQNAD
ncbi:ABC transporter substrate-binding protein, partial [Roseateles sp. GG27B]